ncbi:MAG: fibronectin type III domain-containing protein [Candidatus Shapirobacteria bacterium]|jgi:hypothetical protein
MVLKIIKRLPFLSFVLFFIFSFIFSHQVLAVNRYWVGTAGDENWNNSANWSTNSGMAGGASVPISTDSVVFDENSLGDCTIPGSAGTAFVVLTGHGYTGTLSFGDNDVVISPGDIEWNSGTLNLGTKTVSIDSGVILSGGTIFAKNLTQLTSKDDFVQSDGIFSAPSGNFILWGDFTRSGGTFQHNNGKVTLQDLNKGNICVGDETLVDTYITSAGAAFYDMTVDKGCVIESYPETTGWAKNLYFSDKIRIEGTLKSTTSGGILFPVGTTSYVYALDLVAQTFLYAPHIDSTDESTPTKLTIGEGCQYVPDFINIYEIDASSGYSIITVVDLTDPYNYNTNVLYAGGDNTCVAPVQMRVFPASVSKTTGSSVDIVSSGDATNHIWFAPLGTTTFVEGSTMTTATGDAVTIAAPTTLGDYRLFILDSLGNPSEPTNSILTVTAVDSSPTPTPSNNNSSPSSSSGWSAPACNDPKPVSAPDLFQINITQSTAKLFFTPISNTSQYVISFSTNPNAEEHGATVTLAREGVQNFTVNLLKPNTNYYFKVRGQSGCTPGDWSNVFKVITSARGLNQSTSFYEKFSLKKIIPITTAKIVSKINNVKPTLGTPPLTQVLPTETINNKVNTNPVVNSISPSPTPASKKRCFLWWCF